MNLKYAFLFISITLFLCACKEKTSPMEQAKAQIKKKMQGRWIDLDNQEIITINGDTIWLADYYFLTYSLHSDERKLYSKMTLRDTLLFKTEVDYKLTDSTFWYKHGNFGMTLKKLD